MAKITVNYINHMGDDNSVVNAARVSFDKSADNYTTEQNEKLIRYLARHKHMSSFGHAFASFKVKAPIFVARQLVKHKFLRINEISRRYVDDTPEFYFPSSEEVGKSGWRAKSEDKKQGSVSPDEDPLGWLGVTVGTHAFCMEALERYKWMLEIGICPEQARMVLPQNTMTEWYWSGSLDAFADMAKLRLKSDTQEETRVVAQGISDKMQELFPVSWKELVQHE